MLETAAPGRMTGHALLMPCIMPDPDSQKNGNAGGARIAAAWIRNGRRQIGPGRLFACMITAAMAALAGPPAVGLNRRRAGITWAVAEAARPVGAAECPSSADR